MRAGAKLSVNAIVQYPIPLSTRLLRTPLDLIDFPSITDPFREHAYVCSAPSGTARPEQSRAGRKMPSRAPLVNRIDRLVRDPIMFHGPGNKAMSP